MIGVGGGAGIMWAASRYFNNLVCFSLQTVLVGAAARVKRGTSQHPVPACPWCAVDEPKRAFRVCVSAVACKIHWEGFPHWP